MRRARFLLGVLILALFTSLAALCASKALSFKIGDERAWSRAALLVAFATGFWALVAPRKGGCPGREESWGRGVLAAVGAVLLWSLFVRFVLTAPNILTDGGTGSARLFDGLIGFAGMPSLLDLVLPADGRSSIWSAISVMSALAALTPALVVLLARELELSRRAGFLAGLALASLPLHAAMFRSDFVMGPAVALMVGGLTLIAAGMRRPRGSLICAGSAMLAFVCWLRPEAPVIGGALLGLLWFHRRRIFRSLIGLVGLGWLGLHLVTGFVAHAQEARGHHVWATLTDFVGTHLWNTNSLSWFAAATVAGLLIIARTRRRALPVIVAGVCFGVAPVILVVGDDARGEYLEAFRYGTWSLPFFTLAAGVALDTVVKTAGRSRLLGGLEKGPKRVSAVLVVVLAAIPLLHIPYLQRRYTHVVEEPLVREAVGMIPHECGVVFPEDDPSIGGTHQILSRYRAISFDEMILAVQGVVSFTDSLSLRREFPNGAGPSSHRGQAPRVDCWYFVEAVYCQYGWNNRPQQACADLLDQTEHELVAQWEFEFIHHRQVVYPTLHDRRYDPAATVTLYRLMEPRRQSPP